MYSKNMIMYRRKIHALIVALIFSLLLGGCVDEYNMEEESDTQAEEIIKQNAEQIFNEALHSIEQVYDGNAVLSSEEIRSALAIKGYAVGYLDNSVNLENNSDLKRFCNLLHFGQEGNVQAYLITPDKCLLQFDFTNNSDGLKVNIIGGKIEKGGLVEPIYYGDFDNISWRYSDSGWFLFDVGGTTGFEGDNGSFAVKVTETDPVYRELCQKYMTSTGYADNNLFIADWDVNNPEELNLIDLFDMFYEKQFGEKATAELFPDGIPQDVFEQTIQHYTNLSVDQIREKEDYDVSSGVYWWREGNDSEINTQELPFPDIRSYVENEDGTITLTVVAIWKERCTEYAFVHFTTIEVLDDGSFKYVANEVRIQELIQFPSYTERLRE